MGKKQTAVQWFYKNLKNYKTLNLTDKLIQDLYKQAMQMEKEEMKEAALDNVTTNEKLRKIFEIQFEDFYKETYGGKDE
jgi:hypothetical protein